MLIHEFQEITHFAGFAEEAQLYDYLWLDYWLGALLSTQSHFHTKKERIRSLQGRFDAVCYKISGDRMNRSGWALRPDKGRQFPLFIEYPGFWSKASNFHPNKDRFSYPEIWSATVYALTSNLTDSATAILRLSRVLFWARCTLIVDCQPTPLLVLLLSRGKKSGSKNGCAT